MAEHVPGNLFLRKSGNAFIIGPVRSGALFRVHLNIESPEPSEAKDPQQGLRDRLYEQQSLKCQDNVHQSQRDFDSAILTLSAGLLGLSLAFVKDIVPLAEAIDLPLLYCSWGLSVLAILFTLISFRTSAQAFDAQLPELCKQYIDPNYAPKTTSQAKITRWLTGFECASFIIAVLLTIAFAIVNVQNSNNTRLQDKKSPAEVRGSSAPKLNGKKQLEPSKVTAPQGPAKVPAPEGRK
jgi:hypothetical protein